MEKLTIYTKGLTMGNPGPAAIGVYVEDTTGKEILAHAESIGNATSVYAEYFSVVSGLQALQDKLGNKSNQLEFDLLSENELIISHLLAEATIKDVSLIGHFIEIYNLRVENFPKLSPRIISPLDNKANRLAKRQLDA